MKLITIVNANDVINSLSDKDDIGAHLAYWMTKFVVMTQSDVAFYQSERKKLFEKYGAKNDDGTYTIEKDKYSAFIEEMNILQDTEAEDPGIRFSLSELATALKLSLKQMYPLMDFIDENK